MINQEIVTYLKGEEKLNKGNFIKQWADYCSLIKADKDPGQYLPYLFVIYYFGPNEITQDAAKQLIDDISPKEILQFQDNFISSVRKADAAIVKYFAEDEDPCGGLESRRSTIFFNDEFTAGEDISLCFSDVLDHFEWGGSYLQAFMLPIELISDNLSVSKITLDEAEFTHYFLKDTSAYGDENLGYTTNFSISVNSILKKNFIFFNYCLNGKFLDGLNNFSNKNLSQEHDNKNLDCEICTSLIYLIAKTNLQAAADFLNYNSDGDGPVLHPYYEDFGLHIYECMDLFDDELTYEIRLNHEWMESPSLEETLNHNKSKDSNAFNKKDVISAVTVNGGALQYVSKELKADKEVVMAAVKQNGMALKYASKELQDDKEVVMAAVKNHGFSLQYVSEELKADKEVVMAAVTNSGWALKYASEEFKADKEVVMAALKNAGRLFESVSADLRDDKEVLMTAVKSHAWALEYASKELKADKQVVMATLKSYGIGLEYASKELKDDREVVMAAIKNDGWALDYASKELKDDKEVVLAAVKNNRVAIQMASKKLQKDKDVIALLKKHD